MINLKSILSKEVKEMEAGAFQDFCLDLLPLIDPKYQGLERFGHTVEGKTRKGTPDLIKTLTNGKQIAVQCGTQENYWKKTKDLSKWKPCEDIDSCLAELKDLQEIVLCSNREIPTNLPNIKSDIIVYARNKTSADIDLKALVDIEQILSDKIIPEFISLFKKHLPHTFNAIDRFTDLNKHKLAIELQQTNTCGLVKALSLAEESFEKFLELDKAREYAFSKTVDLNSRFERKNLPSPGTVNRSIPEDYPLLKPFGKIQVCLGIPKIGKTALISRIAHKWFSDGMTIKWFDCSYIFQGEAESRIFALDFVASILKIYVSPENVTDIVNGFVRIEDANIRKDTNGFKETVYIVDNSELLVEAGENLIFQWLNKIKTSFPFTKVGVIFVRNKGLKHLHSIIDYEVAVIPWKINEIKEFLSQNILGQDYYLEESYLKQLEMTCAGHPLIALALARKCRTQRELFLNLIKPPLVADEDLGRELKNFLFEDIIENDVDLLNFVLSMSTLVYSANEKVINVIMQNKILPIVKPFKIILEKLEGNVIEGDAEQGYRMAPVYKEVTRAYFDKDKYSKIYDLISIELLKTEGKSLDALQVSQGICYAILSNNPERAFFWAINLLQSANKSTMSNKQLKNILDSLPILEYINVPENEKIAIMYNMVLLSLSLSHLRIGDNEKAFKILEKMNFDRLKVSGPFNDHQPLIAAIIKIQKMICVIQKDPLGGIKLLDEIDFEALGKETNKSFFPIDSLFAGVVPILPLQVITRNLIGKVFQYSDLANENTRRNLIAVGLDIAVKAKLENISQDVVLSLFPADGILPQLVKLLVETQFLLENHSEEACEKIAAAEDFARKNNLWGTTTEYQISQLKGDVFYYCRRYSAAKEAYLKNLEGVIKKDDFSYGWANFRLGLLSSDPVEAREYFKEASMCYRLLSPAYEEYYAKSEGERALTFVQTKQYKEFVRIVEWILRRYYIRNKHLFAPTVVIAMAQLTRLKHDIENKPLQEESTIVYPKFERGVYARVLSEAVPNINAGMAAFYTLGMVQGLLGGNHRWEKNLRTALRLKTPDDERYEGIKILVIKDFIPLLFNSSRDVEIAEVISKSIIEPSIKTLKSKRFLAYSLFEIFDTVAKAQQTSGCQRAVKILETIEAELWEFKNLILSDECLSWWISELYSRKIKLSAKTISAKDLFRLLEYTYQECKKGLNYTALVEVGHSLGFVYYDYVFTRRELAEIHLEIMRTFSEHDKELELSFSSPAEPYDKLKYIQTFGLNLNIVWGNLLFRRNAEYDETIKKYLVDGARLLKRNSFSREEISMFMILLLSKCFQYDGAITTLAKSEISKIQKTIPVEIKDLLSP
ncbi:MAG: hypothetical protein HQL30_03920 [Candidatus Omnitrophica bacterium]|nr:hypothetical protein [Candidatus Omnitrophota bacterium]